ncbi:MAG: TRAP transporter small permease [Pseudomonadota bacterium]
MRKAENAFCLLLAGLSGLSIFIVFAVVFAGSVSRYAFSSPFQWSEEVAKYAMIYGCMFGTAYAYLRGSQISFSLVTDFLSEQMRTRLSVMVDAATLILGGVLVHAGLIFAGKRGGITSSGLGIPMYWAQIALSVGGVCLFVAAALRLLSALRRNQGGEQPS